MHFLQWSLWRGKLLKMYKCPAQSTSTILLVIIAFSTFVLTAAATGKEQKWLDNVICFVKSLWTPDFINFFVLFCFVLFFFLQMEFAIICTASSHNETYLNSLKQEKKKTFWDTKIFPASINFFHHLFHPRYIQQMNSSFTLLQGNKNPVPS